jgi:hypothetical protein
MPISSLVVAIATAPLSAAFFRRIANQLHTYCDKDHESYKRGMEARRYIFMAGTGVAYMALSVLLRDNRAITYGAGVAGGLCLLDAHAEFYYYMTEWQRTAMMGFVVAGLSGVAIYLDM